MGNELTAAETETPRTLAVVNRGMAHMKAAGLNDAKVYECCAVLVKQLTDLSCTLERQLAECRKECEEQARLNGAGASREAAMEARLAEANGRADTLEEIAQQAEMVALRNTEERLAAEAEANGRAEKAEADARHVRQANENYRQENAIAIVRATAAEAEAKAMREGLAAVAALMRESDGVIGLHLNGDIAPWSELRTGGRFEEWLRDFDAALASTATGESHDR